MAINGVPDNLSEDLMKRSDDELSAAKDNLTQMVFDFSFGGIVTSEDMAQAQFILDAVNEEINRRAGAKNA